MHCHIPCIGLHIKRLLFSPSRVHVWYLYVCRTQLSSADTTINEIRRVWSAVKCVIIVDGWPPWEETAKWHVLAFQADHYCRLVARIRRLIRVEHYLRLPHRLYIHTTSNAVLKQSSIIIKRNMFYLFFTIISITAVDCNVINFNDSTYKWLRKIRENIQKFKTISQRQQECFCPDARIHMHANWHTQTDGQPKNVMPPVHLCDERWHTNV